MWKKQSKFKYTFIILSLLLIISGCGKKANIDVEPEKVVPVNIALSQKEDLAEYRSFPGKVVAVNEVSLSAKMGGKVEEILVKEGDKVRAGQVLIRLEQKDVVTQLNQAQAGLDAALAQLSSLQNAQLPQQIAQLESALNQAEANFTNVNENYERMKGLFHEGAISEQDFEAIELQYKVAKEQYESAKTQLTLTREKSAPESIAAVEAQVKQAESMLAAAEVAMDNCVITSPMDGTVGAINAVVGQMASPGAPIAVVGNLNSVEIEINVTEDKVNGLKVGQEAEVTVDAVGDEVLKGEVVSISPFKDPMTQVYPVKVILPNDDGLLKSGMFARVKLAVAFYPQVVTVPEDSVVGFDGNKMVYTLEGDLAKANIVKTGATSMGRIIIIEGLPEGKEIIVDGQELLTDGMKVSVKDRGDR